MRARVGTRASELALTQTRGVIAALRAHAPELEIEEVPITTSGDADRSTPLDRHAGAGFFSKELERALGAGEIDIAVHSLKDLPTALAPGLELAAIPEREEPWDVFLSAEYPGLADLPAGAAVATGSLRRRAQILHNYPQLRVQGIRGNIDTRIGRYAQQGCAGLILAAAGLRRTGRTALVRSTLSPTEMTPAPGQGALAIELRSDARELSALCRAALEHAPTRVAVTAERSLLARLEGGCHLPIGAFARVVGARLVLLGMLATADGKELVQLAAEGDARDPERVAEDLTHKLLRAGGAEILASLKSEFPS